ADAHKKLDSGYLEAALAAAQKERRDLEHTNPVWSWQFRILEAEILLWEGRHHEVLPLLEPQPPSSLPPELLVRRYLAQARACYSLQEFPTAVSFLKQIDVHILAANPGLLGDATLAKGTLLKNERKFSAAAEELQRALE